MGVLGEIRATLQVLLIFGAVVFATSCFSQSQGASTTKTAESSAATTGSLAAETGSHGSGATPVPPAASAPPFFVTSYPSALRVSPRWLNDVEIPCVTFLVIGPSRSGSVRVTTSGLGRARLAEAVNDKCPLPSAVDKEVLTLPPAVGLFERRIAMWIDPGPLSEPGAAMDGRILVWQEMTTPVVSSLRVERAPTATWFTAVSWFLGIAIPAGITYGFGRLLANVTARSKAKEDFRTFREERSETIGQFIREDLFAILNAKPPVERPGMVILQALHEKKLLSKMPQREFDQLKDACLVQDTRKILALLTKMLPEQSALIDKLRTAKSK